MLFGSSSAATKALCMRFLFCRQRVLYLSWLTHDWDTKIGNAFATTMLHNLLWHCRLKYVGFVTSLQVLSLLLCVFHMAAVELYVHCRLIKYSDCGWGSFVCRLPVFLGNILWKSVKWRLFKGAKVNKEQKWQVSLTESHGYLSSSVTHIGWTISDGNYDSLKEAGSYCSVPFWGPEQLMLFTCSILHLQAY